MSDALREAEVLARFGVDAILVNPASARAGLLAALAGSEPVHGWTSTGCLCGHPWSAGIGPGACHCGRPWADHDTHYPEGRSGPEAGLDAAWRRAEAALPDGWVLDGVRRLYDFGHPTPKFVARATDPLNGTSTSMPLRSEDADTPEAALNALAAALAATPTASPTATDSCTHFPRCATLTGHDKLVRAASPREEAYRLKNEDEKQVVLEALRTGDWSKVRELADHDPRDEGSI